MNTPDFLNHFNEEFTKAHKRLIDERKHPLKSDDVFDRNALQKQIDRLDNEKGSVFYVADELRKRHQKVIDVHPEPRNSLHEAWGFIREEMIELEAELMKKNPRYSQISDEAYDVMITCARLIAFCQDRLHRDSELPQLPDGETWPDDPTSKF